MEKFRFKSLTIVLALSLALTTALAQTKQDKSPLAALMELRQQKVALAREVLNLTKAGYEAGASNYSDLLQAMIDLHNAELPLCETKEQRIAKHQEILEVAKLAAQAARKLAEANESTVVELKRAEMFVLECRIRLEEAKGS